MRERNRLESAIRTLRVSEEGTAAAASRILDADFAMETARLTRSQLLRDAGLGLFSPDVHLSFVALDGEAVQAYRRHW